MTGKKTGQRHPPAPVGIWLVVGVFMVAVAALAALAFLAWQEARQVEVLRSELEKAVIERGAMEGRLRRMEAALAALNDRLAAVEANAPPAGFAAQVAALQEELETASRAGPSESAQLANLQASLATIQSQVNKLQAGTATPGTGRTSPTRGRGSLQSSVPATELPAEARLIVGRQRQSRNLSCESSAVSMVAQYFGLELSESEVLAALPLHENPHLGFRGNVDGPTGGTQDYGVYAGPILDILHDQGLQAWPVEGALDGVRSAIVRGHPVIAWVTYNCQTSTPETVSVDGEAVVLVPWQHVVVVTGYDAKGFWANDPWDGKEDFYRVADFERAMGYFGNMAVEVAPP
jgi:uncharacterized protein YvpB